MNLLKIISLILIISGIVIFFGGIWIYWASDPVTEWGPTFVTIGLLFLLGAVMFLCVSQEYDVV